MHGLNAVERAYERLWSMAYMTAPWPQAGLPPNASSPEPAVQLRHRSRSGGHSTRRGPRTSAPTTMPRGAAHSARDASSGTCAPIVGVTTVPSLVPRSRSRGGCSEPDSDSVASCRF